MATQYQFNAALHIAGRDFPRGLHNDVEEKHESHPHFLKYVNAGLIVEAEKVVAAPKAKSLQARSEALATKLVEKAEARRANAVKKANASKEVKAEVKAVEPESVDESVKSEGAEVPAEELAEEKPKGKHGKNRGK